MPYSSTSELPQSVKDLPQKKQRQWMNVWNSVYSETKDEERAFLAAWSAVGGDKKFIDSEFIKMFSWNEREQGGAMMELKSSVELDKGELRLFSPFLKYDEKENIAYGYFSTESLDSQNQIVESAAIEKALPDSMKWGAVREMHRPLAPG